MRSILEWMLDEKIVLCVMVAFCSVMILILYHWHASENVLSVFRDGVTGLIGALLRGITHQPGVSDSMQNVQSTTTISPKPPEEMK
jgi:hypothetical protein